jgi:hypothetical protein
MSDIARMPNNPISHQDRQALDAYGAHAIAHGWVARFHWTEDDDGDPHFELWHGAPNERLEARIGRSREGHAFYAEDAQGIVFATGALDHVMAVLEERLSG